MEDVFHKKTWRIHLAKLTDLAEEQVAGAETTRRDGAWATTRETQLLAEARARLESSDRASEDDLRRVVRPSIERENFVRLHGAHTSATETVGQVARFLDVATRALRRLDVPEPALTKDEELGLDSPTVVLEVRRLHQMLLRDRLERRVSDLPPDRLVEEFARADEQADPLRVTLLEEAMERTLRTPEPSPTDEAGLEARRRTQVSHERIREALETRRAERVRPQDREVLSSVQARLEDWGRRLSRTHLILSATRDHEQLPVRAGR